MGRVGHRETGRHNRGPFRKTLTRREYRITHLSGPAVHGLSTTRPLNPLLRKSDRPLESTLKAKFGHRPTPATLLRTRGNAEGRCPGGWKWPDSRSATGGLR